MTETRHFIRDAYGWTCKRCRASRDETTARAPHADTLPRFFREGEAEEREPSLSFPLVARWTDDSHRTLACPRCRIEEDLSHDDAAHD
ncbi:MAG: hypothetical protein WCD76_11860 [Pyrinomonadaceae bacterium]